MHGRTIYWFVVPIEAPAEVENVLSECDRGNDSISDDDDSDKGGEIGRVDPRHAASAFDTGGGTANNLGVSSPQSSLVPFASAGSKQDVGPRYGSSQTRSGQLLLSSSTASGIDRRRDDTGIAAVHALPTALALPISASSSHRLGLVSVRVPHPGLGEPTNQPQPVCRNGAGAGTFQRSSSIQKSSSCNDSLGVSHQTTPIATGGASSVAGAAPSRGQLRLHVLFVDDETVNRNVAKRMLQRLGCTTVELCDGDEVEAALVQSGQLLEGPDGPIATR